MIRIILTILSAGFVLSNIQCAYGTQGEWHLPDLDPKVEVAPTELIENLVTTKVVQDILVKENNTNTEDSINNEQNSEAKSRVLEQHNDPTENEIISTETDAEDLKDYLFLEPDETQSGKDQFINTAVDISTDTEKGFDIGKSNQGSSEQQNLQRVDEDFQTHLSSETENNFQTSFVQLTSTPEPRINLHEDANTMTNGSGIESNSAIESSNYVPLSIENTQGMNEFNEIYNQSNQDHVTDSVTKILSNEKNESEQYSTLSIHLRKVEKEEQIIPKIPARKGNPLGFMIAKNWSKNFTIQEAQVEKEEQIIPEIPARKGNPKNFTIQAQVEKEEQSIPQIPARKGNPLGFLIAKNWSKNFSKQEAQVEKEENTIPKTPARKGNPLGFLIAKNLTKQEAQVEKEENTIPKTQARKGNPLGFLIAKNLTKQETQVEKEEQSISKAPTRKGNPLGFLISKNWSKTFAKEESIVDEEKQNTPKTPVRKGNPLGFMISKNWSKTVAKEEAKVGQTLNIANNSKEASDMTTNLNSHSALELNDVLNGENHSELIWYETTSSSSALKDIENSDYSQIVETSTTETMDSIRDNPLDAVDQQIVHNISAQFEIPHKEEFVNNVTELENLTSDFESVFKEGSVTDLASVGKSNLLEKGNAEGDQINSADSPESARHMSIEDSSISPIKSDEPILVRDKIDFNHNNQETKTEQNIAIFGKENAESHPQHNDEQSIHNVTFNGSDNQNNHDTFENKTKVYSNSIIEDKGKPPLIRNMIGNPLGFYIFAKRNDDSMKEPSTLETEEIEQSNAKNTSSLAINTEDTGDQSSLNTSSLRIAEPHDVAIFASNPTESEGSSNKKANLQTIHISQPLPPENEARQVNNFQSFDLINDKSVSAEIIDSSSTPTPLGNPLGFYNPKNWEKIFAKERGKLTNSDQNSTDVSDKSSTDSTPLRMDEQDFTILGNEQSKSEDILHVTSLPHANNAQSSHNATVKGIESQHEVDIFEKDKADMKYNSNSTNKLQPISEQKWNPTMIGNPLGFYNPKNWEHIFSKEKAKSKEIANSSVDEKVSTTTTTSEPTEKISNMKTIEEINIEFEDIQEVQHTDEKLSANFIPRTASSEEVKNNISSETNVNSASAPIRIGNPLGFYNPKNWEKIFAKEKARIEEASNAENIIQKMSNLNKTDAEFNETASLTNINSSQSKQETVVTSSPAKIEDSQSENVLSPKLDDLSENFNIKDKSDEDASTISTDSIEKSLAILPNESEASNGQGGLNSQQSTLLKKEIELSYVKESPESTPNAVATPITSFEREDPVRFEDNKLSQNEIFADQLDIFERTKGTVSFKDDVSFVEKALETLVSAKHIQDDVNVQLHQMADKAVLDELSKESDEFASIVNAKNAVNVDDRTESAEKMPEVIYRVRAQGRSMMFDEDEQKSMSNLQTDSHPFAPLQQQQTFTPTQKAPAINSESSHSSDIVETIVEAAELTTELNRFVETFLASMAPNDEIPSTLHKITTASYNPELVESRPLATNSDTYQRNASMDAIVIIILCVSGLILAIASLLAFSIKHRGQHGTLNIELSEQKDGLHTAVPITIED